MGSMVMGSILMLGFNVFLFKGNQLFLQTDLLLKFSVRGVLKLGLN